MCIRDSYKATLYEVPLLAIVSEIKNQFFGNVADMDEILCKLSEKVELSNQHPEKAVELLGTMQGGYNIHPLIDALDDARLAPIAAKALSHTLLMFDNFYDVEEKAKAGNEHAKQVMQSVLMLLMSGLR